MFCWLDALVHENTIILGCRAPAWLIMITELLSLHCTAAGCPTPGFDKLRSGSVGGTQKITAY